MSDRKAELERKKAKLQAIREEKERRRREKEQKDVRLYTIVIIGLHMFILKCFKFKDICIFLPRVLCNRLKKLQYVQQALTKIIVKKLMPCFLLWVWHQYQVYKMIY